VRDDAAVFAVLQPIQKLTHGSSPDLAQRYCTGTPYLIEDIGELALFGCAAGIDDVPEGGRLWRWRFRVELRDVTLDEVGGNVAVPVIVVPTPELGPISVGEVLFS